MCNSNTFYEKAKSIFDPNQQGSAVSVLCDNMSDDETIKSQVEDLHIDCSKGIVAEGFSQGANLASLGGNYNPNVQAVFLIGGEYKTYHYHCNFISFLYVGYSNLFNFNAFAL